MHRFWPYSVAVLIALPLLYMLYISGTSPARITEQPQAKEQVYTEKFDELHVLNQAPASKKDEANGASKDKAEPTRTKSAQTNPEPEKTQKSRDKKKSQKDAQETASDKNKISSKGQPPQDKKQDDVQSSFGYKEVVKKAHKLSEKKYKTRKSAPNYLSELSVDDWKSIQYKPDYALWQGKRIPFEARFYHQGSFFIHPISVHTASTCAVDQIEFSKEYFDYSDPKTKKNTPESAGYAGIKILSHLNSNRRLDELVSFLGATYFRALPKGAHYGLSARGLAINTASSSGEEFPAFTDFWLVEPEPGDKTLTIYALLDSPSVTGAYKFVVDPGQTTVMEVEVTLFTRTAIKKLGLAPLTSMFAWGENSLHRLDHARPEAHDSDGLLIHNGDGEWVWRPLKNPQQLTINQFMSKNVQGFGLLQRDRKFQHYQHLTYEYENRPSLWVVPKGNWGKGAVELVQIPSDSEINDNIVVYWVPENPVKANEKLHFAYTLKWMLHDPSSHKRATTRSTRVGFATLKPKQRNKYIRIAVEFDGGKLTELPASASVVPHITPMREVDLSHIKTVHNPHTGGWRLSFLVPTSALEKPLDLRAFLSKPSGAPLTETWTYTLNQ